MCSLTDPIKLCGSVNNKSVANNEIQGTSKLRKWAENIYITTAYIWKRDDMETE